MLFIPGIQRLRILYPQKCPANPCDSPHARAPFGQLSIKTGPVIKKTKLLKKQNVEAFACVFSLIWFVSPNSSQGVLESWILLIETLLWESV
jgi:hypothetical protein